MFKLFVFRHGQSTFQCLRIIAGENEYGLTALGKFQTQKIAQEMVDMKFDYVLSSDIRRSCETLDIILSFLKHQPAQKNIYYTQAIREKEQGILKMRNINTTRQNDYDRQAKEEGGESWDEVYDRVEGLIHFFLKKLFNHDIQPNNIHKVCSDLQEEFQVNHKTEIPQILLITHFGFIKELIYLIKRKLNGHEDKEREANIGYYAQNAALFEINISITDNNWIPQIMMMNSNKPLYQPFK